MKTYTLATLALVLFSFRSPMQAQWIQTNGPAGGRVSAFCASPNGVGPNGASGTNLFVGVEDDIYLSTDDGKRWIVVDSDPRLDHISSFAVSLNGSVGVNLFAGSYQGGVFLSTNNGKSWTRVDSGLTNTDVVRLAVIGTNLFAGTWGGGIFRSTDNGTSWTSVDSGLTGNGSNFVGAFAVDGTTLFAGTNGGLFLSTDSGANWTGINAGLNPYIASIAVSYDGVGGRNLFAGSNGGGMFRSSDNGASWTPVNSGLTYQESNYTMALAVVGANLVRGGDPGIFFSTNSGASWTHSDLANYDIEWLAVSPNGTGPNGASGTKLFAGTVGSGGGIYVSADSGRTWRVSNSGIRRVGVNSLAVAPNGTGRGLGSSSGTNLFAASFSSGVFLSTDIGTSWNVVSSGFTNTNILAFGVSPNGASGMNVFAQTYDHIVYRSTNYGTSWTATSPGFPNIAANAFVASGTDVYASTYDGVFRSTDNGMSWTAANAGLVDTSVIALAAEGAILFAGTGSGIFLSTDNGTSWTSVDTGVAHYRISAFGVIHNRAGGLNIFAAGWRPTGKYRPAENKAWRSDDSGASWIAASPGIPNKIGVNAFAVSGTDVYAATNAGVFLSTDNGMNWTSAGSGLKDSGVVTLAVEGTNLLAGTRHSGVWRYALGETFIAERTGGELPKSFELEQNYPNPFNPSTRIEFQVPSSARLPSLSNQGGQGLVSLKVYDVLGREVRTLVNEELKAGSYVATFDASGLASGVYFYRLQAAEFTNTKKLLLVH